MKNSVNDSMSAADTARLSYPLAAQLQNFSEFGTATRLVQTQGQLISGERITVPTYVNEFWTAKQRQASSLHEVSYRACFKPQLPRFFIERLTQPGDVVWKKYRVTKHTHNPVDDARGNAEALKKFRELGLKI